MRYFFKLAAGLIFVPLFLAALFMMPLEFCVASWHLWRVDSITEGRVTFSEQQTHRGNTRSVLRYTYTVDGRDIEGNRVRAGWISHSAYEAGAGALAKSTSAGSPITIRYDSRHPEFSLVEYGWPKWSVGFSLFMWGFLGGAWVFGPEDKQPSSHLLYGLTRGAVMLAFFIISLLPSTLQPGRMPALAGFGLVLVLLASVYSQLRFSRTA